MVFHGLLDPACCCEVKNSDTWLSALLAAAPAPDTAAYYQQFGMEGLPRAGLEGPTTVVCAGDRYAGLESEKSPLMTWFTGPSPWS